jgi:hypothetical protein
MVMSALNSCSIHINAQQETVLRYSDRCNVQNKPRVSWIAANNFILTNMGYRWEFQKLDDQGNNVGQPIVYTTTRSNQFVNLGNVSQLEYDTHYDVKCAPQFSYGTGTLGTAYELCIAPFSGFTDNSERSTQVSENQSNQNIFPNPASTHFQIQLSSEVKSLQLVNSIGEVVQTWNSQESLFELNQFPNGIYFVHWEDAEGKHSEKLIVLR